MCSVVSLEKLHQNFERRSSRLTAFVRSHDVRKVVKRETEGSGGMNPA